MMTCGPVQLVDRHRARMDRGLPGQKVNIRDHLYLLEILH